MRSLWDKLSTWGKDAAERVFWTAAEAGLAAVPVATLDLDPIYMVPITAGLAWLKAIVAKHVGDSDSAAVRRKRS